MESTELSVMRAITWQRAKGELQAVLATYAPPAGSLGAGGPEKAEAQLKTLHALVQRFIDDIEAAM